MTYTFAKLEVSEHTFNEIKAKLEAAGYGDQFIEDDGEMIIDMHGIVLVAKLSGKRGARAW